MLAVAMGFTACTSDDVTSTPDTPKQITVYATTEQPSATRTSLNVDEGYEVLWSADDKIMLINEALASTYAEFTLNKDYAGQSTGEFTGSKLNEGTYTAYYPADYDGTSWPTAQTYVAKNIPQGVPMKATGINIDYDGTVDHISFKNVGGILRLNLKGEAKVTSITISATGLDAITLSCGTGVQLDADMATPFYIAVPGADDPGTAYSGLKIVVTDDAGKTCTKTANASITVQRSMITDINLTASSFKASTTGKAKATIGGSEVDVNWVQLWADGPKFAEYNVGATSVTEYGGYYTWCTDLDHYYNDLYSNDGDLLKGTDDNAIKLWGTNWRTPTIGELTALINNCNSEWTGNYNNSGIKGRIYTGKGDYSSNRVFLPAAGAFSYNNDPPLTEQGESGNYWSSTSGAGTGCYLLCFSSGSPYAACYAPNNGYSVRAVLAK